MINNIRYNLWTKVNKWIPLEEKIALQVVHRPLFSLSNFVPSITYIPLLSLGNEKMQEKRSKYSEESHWLSAIPGVGIESWNRIVRKYHSTALQS